MDLPRVSPIPGKAYGSSRPRTEDVFRARVEAAPHASLRGRRGPVKVTRGRSFSASAGPMPRTSQSASIDPNGPTEFRFEMMRAARAGPIPGSDSMAAESARSMSTGPDGIGTGPPCFSRPRPGRDARGARGVTRTESTRPSCRSSAATACASASILLARHIRTLPPESATRARNIRALRSFEVGTTGSYIRCVVTLASFNRTRGRFSAPGPRGERGTSSRKMPTSSPGSGPHPQRPEDCAR